jgi:hypothetical protein
MLGKSELFIHKKTVDSEQYMKCLEEALLPATKKFYPRRKIKF